MQYIFIQKEENSYADHGSFAGKASTATARKKIICNQNKSEYFGIESLGALKIQQENPTKDEKHFENL